MVKLVDTFYYNYHVSMLLTDLLSGEILLRNHVLDKGQTRCQWKLFDVDALIDILFAREELRYPERTNRNNDDDLLKLEDE